jgi:hypothetical protein
MRGRMIALMLLVLGAAYAGPLSAREPGPEETPADEIERTPPRLSFVKGNVSFFRPGDPDWDAARVNMPLSPGDRLASGDDGTFELEVGPDAFVRGWTESRIGLEDQEPDRIRFRVAAGSASFDLFSLDPGQTLEVETPGAVFAIDRPGYYRVDVDEARTAFTARRGGRAAAESSAGESFGVDPEEEALIEGEGDRPVSIHPAPPRDGWDDWNRGRSAYLMQSSGGRHVPRGVYGSRDLDRHGRWHEEPDYGPVWVPSGVPADWAPYSSGAWVLDPHYGWTWVDAAPWGWAPFHYGRWINLNGRWCWAPGPPRARPVYAPALVAFYGGTPARSGFYARGPQVGWVALGWGEPCVPWWGRPGFIHRPWWGGWHGPRIVNNTMVHRTRVVNVNDIHTYRNAGVRNGLVAVHEDHFRGRHVPSGRFARVDANDLRPIHAAPRFQPPSGGRLPDNDRVDQDRRRNPRRLAPMPSPSPRRDFSAGPPAAHRSQEAPAPSPGDRIVPAPQPEERNPHGRNAGKPRPVNERPENGDRRGRVTELQPDPGGTETLRHSEGRRERKPDQVRRAPSEPLPQRRQADGDRPIKAPSGPERYERRDRTPPVPLPSQMVSPRRNERRPPGESSVRAAPNPGQPDPRRGPERPEPRDRDQVRPPIGT